MTAPTATQSAAPATWLRALRIYLGVSAVANLAGKWSSCRTIRLSPRNVEPRTTE
jgi:hypothetical protein